MSEQKTPAKPSPADDEIDLLELVKTLWNGRKTVLIAIISGAMLGVLVAILSPKEYTATTVIVPQLAEGQSKLGSLGGLAALAGISIDVPVGADMTPMAYPQIVNSTPFQLELMNTPIYFEEFSKPITFFDYYIQYKKTSVLSTISKYTIGLPGVIIQAIRGKSKELSLPAGETNLPLQLTKDQISVQKMIKAVVSLELNAKDGYLTITCKMPEALAAAQLVKKSQELLQRFVIEFKIAKVKANLDFIQSRYNEVKTEFEKEQLSLALLTDRNKNFTSGLPQIEFSRVQTRYTIAFGVFQELAKQLEQAKIQVKKETPVFTIVQPATVPSEKSKPKKPMIVFIWLFLGGIVGVGWVFGKVFMKDIKLKWNETK
jgi:hypothetical protein